MVLREKVSIEILELLLKAKDTDLEKYFSLTRIKFSDPKTKKRIEGYLLGSLV